MLEREAGHVGRLSAAGAIVAREGGGAIQAGVRLGGKRLRLHTLALPGDEAREPTAQALPSVKNGFLYVLEWVGMVFSYG